MGETPHIALPLKYRPMTFDDVVGQEHVVRTLRHAIETGRVANAYLFIGSRGIGKTTLSRIFAKALNCLEPRGVEPCGQCANCREIAEGRSLDVIELDAASHNKVEDVRPIIDAVDFRPASSKYKIFIIDECHMLSPSAWNALLKTLEEPPAYVRFIFATTEGDKVLPTIVSRCQRFDLRRIQTNDIVSRLRKVCAAEHVRADDDALLAIARGAEGGMRDALSSLDQLIAFKGGDVTEEDALGVFGLVSRTALENLARAVLQGDVAAILSGIEAFDSAGKDMRRVAAELMVHFRNLVVIQALGSDAPSLVATEDQRRVLAEQAALVAPARVFGICDLISDMEDKLAHVLSVRTLIEMTLIRASRVATTATIEELLRAVQALRSGAGASAAIAAIAPSAPAASVSAPAPAPAPAAPAASSPVQSAPVRPAPPLPEPEDLIGPARAPVVPSPRSAASSGGRRQAILNDDKINGIIDAIAGASIADIREGRK